MAPASSPLIGEHRHFAPTSVGGDGAILETVSAPHGILAVADKAFDAGIGKPDRQLGYGPPGPRFGHDHQPPGLGGTALRALPRKSQRHSARPAIALRRSAAAKFILYPASAHAMPPAYPMSCVARKPRSWGPVPVALNISLPPAPIANGSLSRTVRSRALPPT